MNFGEFKAPFSSLSYALAASADRGLNPTRRPSLTPDSEEFLPNYWINWALEKQKSVKLWWTVVPGTACPLIGCLWCTSTHCCWQYDSNYYHGNQTKLWSDLNRCTIQKRKGFSKCWSFCRLSSWSVTLRFFAIQQLQSAVWSLSEFWSYLLFVVGWQLKGLCCVFKIHRYSTVSRKCWLPVLPYQLLWLLSYKTKSISEWSMY